MSTISFVQEFIAQIARGSTVAWVVAVGIVLIGAFIFSRLLEK